MRTRGYRAGVRAGESRFVILGRHPSMAAECWGARLRFVLWGGFPAGNYLALWKMMPSVWRCPRSSLLTPWRKFAR